ncbi:MAG: hypothetical protein JOZ98_14075 [Solirubrobacterales bacterium]|nr:hypothetical protein [Solirubrobacterales bacterium]
MFEFLPEAFGASLEVVEFAGSPIVGFPNITVLLTAHVSCATPLPPGCNQPVRARAGALDSRHPLPSLHQRDVL